ncbi:uncharacterized protein LOC131243502 [Magnolia sinica]|uniref:uncharacterized protein LOC131243502 n=1 Tax=Magnolia sinica TaxID=86752 RepID=UPI002658D885|nr:uncharacterized protein LOC131243502 [Magnolia sinica]
MDSSILFVAILLLSVGVDKAHAVATVGGSVFCDQCKDGKLSLFDYPLIGAKVSLTCPGSDGKPTVLKEETSNWYGGYGFKFDDSPDLRKCSVQVVPGSGQVCGAAAGPAQSVKLLFDVWNLEVYIVDAVLSQPANPRPFCQKSSGSPVSVPALAPPTPPSAQLPPFGQFPPNTLPQGSVCSHESWSVPQYKCYWKVVGPDTKVAVAFGLEAAMKYGTDMTLWEGLQGKGDVYRTLLREGTTALLNSYNSYQFAYPTLSVIAQMNQAMMGGPQQALKIALRFKRANHGSANVRCNFSPCK